MSTKVEVAGEVKAWKVLERKLRKTEPLLMEGNCYGSNQNRIDKSDRLGPEDSVW